MSNTDARGLQADLNAYATALGFPGVVIDGKIGPATTAAVGKVVAAVLAKNSLLVPAGFTYDAPAGIAEHADRVRDWLHTTAATTLGVSPFRVYRQGTGKDWNVKGDIVYGAGAVHDDFVALQRDLNELADAVGFKKLDTDGFIGPRTAAAVKLTYDRVVAKNSLFGVTMFPPPDSKEEAAQFTAFIRDWLANVASPQLVAEKPSA